MLLLSLAVASISLLQVSAAGLGKPVLFPQGLHDPLKQLNNLPRPATKNKKDGVAVPQICKDFAKGTGCDASKITARRVQFSDCDEPWVLCRCADANMSMDSIENRWAHVPAGMRSYTGAVLATKASGCSAVNFNGQFIRFHGNCPISVFLHEAGHSVDKGMSGSDAFHKAVSKSTCVPDDYSNSAYAEDWTQNNVLYTFTEHFRPLKEVSGKKDPTCLHPQLQLLRDDKRVKEAQQAKKCLASRRPFHNKRDLEEFDYARELMPEPETDLSLFKPVAACNFTQSLIDRELSLEARAGIDV